MKPSPVSVKSLSNSEDSDFSSVSRDGPCTADSVTDHVFDSSTSEDSAFDLLDADACNSMQTLCSTPFEYITHQHHHNIKNYYNN